MTTADEVAEGARCAVCEERFTDGERVQYLPATGEFVHPACWS